MLRSWDGFDHYNDATDWKSRVAFIQYQQPATNASPVSFVTGRNGVGKALNLNQNNTNSYIVFGQRVANAYAGFAVQFNGTGQGGYFSFWDSVTGLVQMTMWFNPLNYSVQFYRGPAGFGGTGQTGVFVFATANNVWTANSWMYVEFWPIIDPTTGSFSVYINDILVGTFTGVTLGPSTGGGSPVTPNTWWDMMGLLGYNISGSGSISYDDLYYGDTTTPAGTYPFVAPIGDSHVQTLFAIGNNSVQWTPFANTNYQEINEVAMDSDASYNSSHTVGQEDTFNYQTLPAAIAFIFGVQVTGAYRKDDSGGREVKQTIISSATQVYGGNHSLNDSSYVYFTDAWTLDPATAALWNVSAVNAVMAGYNVAV